MRDVYESTRLPYILTKFTHSEHVIELLKLFGMLEVPKPADYKLDDIQKRFDTMEKIQAIPSEDYFKEKDKRGDRMSARSVVVEFLIGLLIGKFIMLHFMLHFFLFFSYDSGTYYVPNLENF